MAVDLRGYGDSEVAPVDASRGLRDFSDDLAEVLTALDLEPAHLVGWSMGAGVVMQYAIDHPARTMTLISPISPYGFGGTAADGSLLNADASGTGGGGVNPDFIARLRGRRPEQRQSDVSAIGVRHRVREARVRLRARGPLGRLDADHRPGVDNYPGDSMHERALAGLRAGRPRRAQHDGADPFRSDRDRRPADEAAGAVDPRAPTT